MRLVSVTVAIAILCAPLLAHEGHAALPTTGVKVSGNTLLLSEGSREAIGLDVVEVREGNLHEFVLATAVVEIPPQAQVLVTPAVPGTVLALHVSPGQRVQPGDPIATLGSREYEALQSGFLRALLDRDRAEAILERRRALAAQHAIPEVALLDALREARGALQRVESMRHRLAAGGMASDDLEALARDRNVAATFRITSPRAGVVLDLDVSVGDVVGADVHLAQIASPEEFWIRCAVPAAWAHRVSPGQAAEISFHAGSGNVIRGVVDRVAPSIDPERHVRDVWVRVQEGRDGLQPGMFGRARIAVQSAQFGELSTIAPPGAIIASGAERFVFVEEKPGAYTKRSIVTGIEQDGATEIREGLYPGDRIVRHGSHELSALIVHGVAELSVEARANGDVRTEPVGVHPVAEVVEAVGTVLLPPARAVGISPQLSARVARVHAVTGDRVGAGDPIADLEGLDVADLQQSWIEATIEVAWQSAEVARLDALAADRIPSGDSLLAARTALAKSLLDAETAGNRLRMSGFTAEQIDRIRETATPMQSLTLCAPMAGTLSSLEVVPGHVVGKEEVLARIVDASNVWVHVRLFQTPGLAIGEGTPARLFPGGRGDPPMEGTVAHTVPSLRRHGDVGPRAVEVFVEVANPDGRLLPGQAVDVALETAPGTPILSVPLGAVLRTGTLSQVFVETPQARFERRVVRTGHRDGLRVAILSGLSEGEQAVVSGVAAVQTAIATVK